MGAINGTSIIIYSDGLPIAMQKGMSITVDIDLPDATNKESAGWAEHIQGMLSAKIDFDSIFATSVTAGMDATHLMDYILNRQSLLVSVLGLSFPIIGQVDMASISFNAPAEGAMTLSGSLTANGGLFPLTAKVPITGSSLGMSNRITDPDEGGTDYDTLTVSGTAITSAINAAGNAYCNSNDFTCIPGAVYKLAFFLTKTSGQLPTVGIWDDTSAYNSNTQAAVEGLNFITLTATNISTDVTSSLRFSNTGAANWSTTPIYLFRVS